MVSPGRGRRRRQHLNFARMDLRRETYFKGGFVNFTTLQGSTVQIFTPRSHNSSPNLAIFISPPPFPLAIALGVTSATLLSMNLGCIRCLLLCKLRHPRLRPPSFRRLLLLLLLLPKLILREYGVGDEETSRCNSLIPRRMVGLTVLLFSWR